MLIVPDKWWNGLEWPVLRFPLPVHNPSRCVCSDFPSLIPPLVLFLPQPRTSAHAVLQNTLSPTAVCVYPPL